MFLNVGEVYIGYKRISKRQARKAYDNGARVAIAMANVPVTIDFNPEWVTNNGRSFDDRVKDHVYFMWSKKSYYYIDTMTENDRALFRMAQKGT